MTEEKKPAVTERPLDELVGRLRDACKGRSRSSTNDNGNGEAGENSEMLPCDDCRRGITIWFCVWY